MKTIEEKAKRYDEAIEKMQSMMKSWETLSYNGKTFLQDIKYIFPELKETEDERIRKQLLKHLREVASGKSLELSTTDYERWATWVAKQGEKGINGKNMEIPFSEQKPNPCGNCGIATNNCQNFPCVIRDGEQKSTDKVEPKFRIGDIIKDTEDGEVFTIRTITKDKYIYTDDSFDWIKDQDEYELVEQKPADKVEQKGMNIVEEYMTPFQKKVFCIIDTTIEEEQGLKQVCDELLALASNEIEQNSAWSEEDEDYYDAIIAKLEVTQEDAALTDNQMNFLKSLKGRIQPQPKQEWSQNDIDMIDWLIRCCEKEHEELCNDKYGHQDIVSDLKRDCRKKWNWLESLKNKVIPQSHWKPSEEQMSNLWNMVCECRPADQQLLQDLYYGLKTLKGE